MPSRIKTLLSIILALACMPVLAQDSPSKPASQSITEQADDRGTLIFEDDFERNESQEIHDDPGNGWKTNSKNRAEGKKQVDLKDGAMYIYRHQVADHNVSVSHPAEFKDGSLEIKFKLEDEQDKLGLDFADLKCKEVHAGHLFRVTISTKFVDLKDLKTGVMNLKTRELKQANKLSKEQKEQLKTKVKRFKNNLETGKWYTALATLSGDNLRVSIDGKEVGSFSSEGFAHPTKRLLRLAIEKNVVVDDLKIFSKSGSDKPAIAKGGGRALKVLLVAGGCCHDYVTQTKLLKEGIEARINADVTVVLNEDRTTKARFEIYEKDDWAVGYDVIIHDECSANVTEVPYVNRILNAHLSGVPAVNIHCAMHSYRWGNFRKPVEPGAGNAAWYEMIGIQSTGHGPKFPIDVKYVDDKNSATKGLESWTTLNEELYNNVRVFSGVEVLATGTQMVPPNKKQLEKNPNAKAKTGKAVVVWANLYGPNKTKIFSTSLGHENKTVGDDRYLDLIVRGLLWSTDNLTAEGKPTKRFVKQK